jgi:hypothetical protein
MVARWKLAQARKFGLDVYWISQHENRVNSVLRDLTHMIYVCQAYMGGKYFVAFGYEPECVRKKGEHIDRLAYKRNDTIANLYDTLEILDADEHLVDGDEGMKRAGKLGADYNAQRKGSGRRRRCRHEIENDQPMGRCGTCSATHLAASEGRPAPAPVVPVVPAAPVVVPVAAGLFTADADNPWLTDD